MQLDINELDEKFLSRLIIAVYQNDLPMAKYLLDKGADINYSGPENCDNPLTIAVKKSNQPMIQLLIQYHPKLDIVDKYLKTSLHYLFLTNNHNNIDTDTKLALVNLGPNLNMADNNMDTILNLLIANDDWKLYESILAIKKLKIYQENRDKIRPIDYVEETDLEHFFQTVYQSYLTCLKVTKPWLDPVDNLVARAIKSNTNIGGYKSYIIHKIVVKKLSYPTQVSNQLNFIIPHPTNATHFSSYTFNYICYLYHILSKYPQIKIPIMPSQIQLRRKDLYQTSIKNFNSDSKTDCAFRSVIRDYITHSPSLINHIIVWKNPAKYFISSNIASSIKHTVKKYPFVKFIILKLTVLTDNNFNHANIIIYDLDLNCFERFDPYGSVPFLNNNEIDHMLQKFVASNFPTACYLSPSMTNSNGISFQIFSDEQNKLNYVPNDPNGFCVGWCLWYIEIRTRNPNVPPKSLIKKAIGQINKNNAKFKNYIRSYSSYLDKSKNKLLARAGVPSKYWYKLEIPSDIYKSYLRYIRRSYKMLC